jgi:nucleotide-binding universal stress UspA family protein
MTTSGLRKIIVGYDGSEEAKYALGRAVDIAAREEVTVVAVAEPYPRSGVTIPANCDALELRERRKSLDEAHVLLAEAGIPARTLLERGDPAEVLVRHAADADLVVVGARPLSRLQRVLLGSVSIRVAQGSTCDVLVARSELHAHCASPTPSSPSSSPPAAPA